MMNALLRLLDWYAQRALASWVITLRSVKGSALTHAEMDANFTTLRDVASQTSGSLSGLTAVSATTVTATTIGGTPGFSGLATFNAGATVANGQTLTLTGATVAGAPTWSSSQAITLSTAAQPNVTSVGTLTGLTVNKATNVNVQALTGNDATAFRWAALNNAANATIPFELQGSTVKLLVNATDGLSIAATGAATFSHSLTAGAISGTTITSTGGTITSSNDMKIADGGYFYTNSGSASGTVKAGWQALGTGPYLVAKLSDATILTIASAGLAVTGTGSFSGDITSTASSTTLLKRTGASTAAQGIQIANTSGGLRVGVESSTGGVFITGSTAYDAIVSSVSGLAFSANDGAGMQMRLSATGLAVTGTLGASSDFAIATSKFTVAAATGNTLIAGTLGVTGATSVGSLLPTSTLSGGGVLGIADTGTGSLDLNAPTGKAILMRINGTTRVTVDGTSIALAGMTYINETANAGMTTGLTINQGAADDEILSFKSSDIAHGMTDLAETDTYAFFKKNSAADGGLYLLSFANDTSTVPAVVIRGVSTADQTTKATTSAGVIILSAKKKGTTTYGNPGANANLMVIQGSVTRFIFDEEGSAHADVEWIAFDHHDDITLLNGLNAEMLSRRGVVHENFGEWVRDSRDALQREGIFNFYDDGPRAMMNMTKMHMLEVGAIRQLSRKSDELVARLGLVEKKLLLQ